MPTGGGSASRAHREERERAAGGRRGSKTRRLVKAAFHEVERDEPEVVGKTRAKFGEKRAERQKIAIALDKARRAGARIPRRK